MAEYDYLLVESGLFSSVFAHEMNKLGKRCLIIEKRKHIGGNIYTEKKADINVHMYGTHISTHQTKKYGIISTNLQHLTGIPIVR